MTVAQEPMPQAPQVPQAAPQTPQRPAWCTDEYVRKLIKGYWSEWEDATNERRAVWKTLWEQYQCTQDYSKKESWQAKMFLPKLFMYVTRQAALIKRAILATDKLFTLKANEELKEQEGYEQALEMAESKFKNTIAESSFSNAIGECAVPAMLLGIGWIKEWPDEGLQFECPDTFDVAVDPLWKPFGKESPRFVVQFKPKMNLARLLQEAKTRNETAGQEIYNIEAIKRAGTSSGGGNQPLSTSDENSRRGLGTFTMATKTIDVYEAWVDIPNEDGTEVVAQQLVMVSGSDVIRWQDSPFERPPFYPMQPLIYPHRGLAGNSMVEPLSNPQRYVNNVANLMFDNLQWLVNAAWELDMSNVSKTMNPADVTKRYPGNTIYKNSGNPALSQVATSGAGLRDALMVLQYMDREMQAGSAVNEWVQALPSEGASTATEQTLKASASQGFFDVIARDIELNTIKPLLELAIELDAKYGGNEALAATAPGVIVGGLSVMLKEDKLVERIGGILRMSLEAPLLAQMTDIPELWRTLLGIYNLERCYREPQPMQMGGPGMPGMPGGAGGAPGQGGNPEAQGQMDARQAVQGMSPQQIEEALAQVEGQGQ
jgi:hypothetical protein